MDSSPHKEIQIDIFKVNSFLSRYEYSNLAQAGSEYLSHTISSATVLLKALTLTAMYFTDPAINQKFAKLSLYQSIWVFA